MSKWKKYAYHYHNESETLKSERDAALERVAVLEKALQFYSSNWHNYCGDHGVPIGMEPSERLLNDMGAVAKSALWPRKETTHD